ncbi:MAG: hypothetical protein Q8N16_02305 [bacterium]|nr:hypothetical protein [bacterium]
MKNINHAQFKKMISEVPSTTLEDISILLPDEYFECKLSKITSKERLKTMFLGLNRSLPNLYRLELDNMRHPILALIGNFKSKNIREKLKGSYLSDFIKHSILRKFLERDKYTNSGEVYAVVRANPEILEKCGEALLKEIAVFQIKTVFCFGGTTYYFIKKFFKDYYSVKLNEINSKRFSVKIDNRMINFVQLTHYSGRAYGAKEKIENELRDYYKDKSLTFYV